MKKQLIRIALSLSLGLFLFVSCEKEETKETPVTPTIRFASATGEYLVKAGGSVTLAAAVENAVQPVFSWSMAGKIVSTDMQFTFVAGKVGEYFVNFRVDAANGSAEEQVKVSVLDKLPPTITLPSPVMTYVGRDLLLTAEADNADNATCVWRGEGGEIVSEDRTFLFTDHAEKGTFIFTLKVTTDDGVDLKNISIAVIPEQGPELYFDDGHYRTVNNTGYLRTMSVPIGKSLVLAPVICNIPNPAAFAWTVDGAPQAATGEHFTFTPAAEGVYLVGVTEQGTQATAEVQVTCTPAEETYRRAGGVRAIATKAFEFIPAPGQFINYQSGTTATALNTLQTALNGGGVPYIGAYGGYWIVGFDHSVNNEPDKADLFIDGNAFPGWCEPGIVWVMQDNNGNGLPDDTWYELAGSEAKKSATKYRYSITYYKPDVPYSNTLWVDNLGQFGSIDWLGYHTQQYYYPMFIAEDAYTLTGTCLASTAYDAGYTYSTCYDWGYADGLSANPDRPNKQFWIEDAIQADGSPASLKFIDFVKVHTGTTGKGSAVGEISTEPGIPTDLNFNND